MEKERVIKWRGKKERKKAINNYRREFVGNMELYIILDFLSSACPSRWLRAQPSTGWRPRTRFGPVEKLTFLIVCNSWTNHSTLERESRLWSICIFSDFIHSKVEGLLSSKLCSNKYSVERIWKKSILNFWGFSLSKFATELAWKGLILRIFPFLGGKYIRWNS